MSYYCYVANISKREYIDPRTFGETGLPREYPEPRTAFVLAMLTCDMTACFDAGALAGSWVGDRVVVAAASVNSNAHGFLTSTEEEPDRNLYTMVWQEFRDISHAALALLCNVRHDVAQEMIVHAKTWYDQGSSELFFDLGKAQIDGKSRDLKNLLCKHFGEGWQDIFAIVRTEWDHELIEDSQSD